MKPLAVTIAPMNEADVPAVVSMEGAPTMTEAQVREELARPWARLWVANDSTGLAGYVVSWNVVDELHVLNVATHPGKRRRGVARALMLHAVDFARERRLKHLLLEVRRSNRAAIALYKSVGFYAMGVRPRYYPDDEDAVEMVLLLDPKTGHVIAHADEV